MAMTLTPERQRMLDGEKGKTLAKVMKTDLKRRTPAGLHDLTPEAYAQKRGIERKIEKIFEGYGYRFISSPTLEYRAVFEGKGGLPTARMYGFPDQNGDMLALRPDMTPAAARIAATHPRLGLGEKPLRLCYIEKAFRNQEYLQGKDGEFTQAGAELYGVCSPDADAEMVALAVESLKTAGLRGFRVDIGQVDFLRGVLEGSGLDDACRRAVARLMLSHDYVGVEHLIEASGETVTESARVILSDLTRWIGGADVLKQAEAFASHPLSVAALRHLEEVYELLNHKNLNDYVLFDLSMTGHFDYYTGIVFRGYASGAGYAVVDGGRYDNLLAAFGKASPAVGFGIRLEGLMDALNGGGRLC
ncbi:MAG: ATP phosphoribosyltransferase regulatory subunit [Clostridiales bacterium]|jgi:ATP phosphoribosyltransferase regulatory subunit|nr:ATP phosphoribosyltransferase regulatory subunit [Clostridiales bacterium]